MKNLITFLIANVIAINFAFSQGASINTNGANADPSAMLDVSSTTQGMLIPRMTTIQRNGILSPAAGLEVYQTDGTLPGFYYFDGTTWKQEGDNLGNHIATQNLDMDTNKVVNVAVCTQNLDAANKEYVDSLVAAGGGAPNAACLPDTAGIITGADSVCQGQTGVSYYVPPITNAQGYVWTLPYGASIASYGSSNSIVVNFAADAISGTISVFGTSTGCGGAPSSFPVTVSAAPVSTFVVNAVHTGIPLVFAPTVPGAASYKWIFNGGSIGSSNLQNPIVSWASVGTYPISLTVTSSNGCSSTTSATIYVTASQTQTFNVTSAEQTWTVPQGFTFVIIDCYGAQGRTPDVATGGKGGQAKGTLAVTGGQVLHIYVGKQATSGTGGYNGGGNGASFAGGGASDVRTVGGLWNDGASLNSRMIVAGGGGGEGYTGSYLAGGYGGANPTAGGSSDARAKAGGPATIGAGGIAGTGNSGNGTAGGWGYGGAGYAGNYTGGGGGGYYGGGGGGGYTSAPTYLGGGGGGGINYIAPSFTSTTNSDNINTGDGKVIITW